MSPNDHAVEKLGIMTIEGEASLNPPLVQAVSVVRKQAAAGDHPARKPALRVVPEIDKDPVILAYAERWPGRILLCAAFTALLGLLGANPLIAPLAAASAYAGPYRWHVIPFATLLLLVLGGFLVDIELVTRVASQEGIAGLDPSLLAAGMIAAVFVLCVGALKIYVHLAPLAWFRWPALFLSACFLSLVLLAESPVSAGMPRLLLWSFLAAVLPYLWFLAYALGETVTRGPPSVAQQLGVFHPFWGSTLTPFGKSASYLRKFEARNSQELAVTQLKGLKLLAWSVLLAACRDNLKIVVHGYLGVPDFDTAFLHFLSGAPLSRPLSYASLLDNFAEDVLTISVWGGIIIACARLAGFRLLRNTYRPLEATTLIEFWNRYYFYYKELLVDHFFYPTFLRFFRTRRRLRMFFATFAAACLGNLLFHFLRDIRFVAEMGLSKALAGEASHAFYTFLLAIGLGLSQMRTRVAKVPKGWLRGRALPCAGVVLFFCALHVFDAPLDRGHSIWQRGQFFLYLLGIDT